jgi:hypothetical protein
VAQDSWPSPAHNARNVTDPEYEKIASRFSDNGIDGSPAGDPVVSAGTGLSVNVRSGVYGSLRGHAWSSGTSTVVLAIAANASGQTRTDRVVLRLDRSAWTVRAVVKQGTPGAGAPPLTQDLGDTGVYEILLANVTVLNNAASVTVTRNELYTGSRFRPCTSTTRNPTPALGEVNFEVDTGRSMQWTGIGWRAVSDDSGIININAPFAAWDNAVESVLQKRNGSVHLRLGAFERAGGTLAENIESRLPAIIPDAYRHSTRDQYCLAYISGSKLGRIIIYSKAHDTRAGQVWLTHKPVISTGNFVLPASGISWVVD